MSKIIGVIGGAGVAATNKLCELIEIDITKNGAYRDSHHIEMIIYQASQSPSRSMYLEGRGESFIESYIDIAKKLESCGAQILCMCCNTAHFAIDIIQKEVNIKMINLIKEIVLRVKDCKVVGLIASDGCLKGKVYEKYFETYAPDIKIIYPDSKYQKLVTKGICNIKNIHRFDKLDSKNNPTFIFKKVVKHLKAKIRNTYGGGVNDLDSINAPLKKGQGDCDYKIIIGCTDIRVSFYDKDVLDSLEVLKDLVIESSEIKKEKDMTNKQALEFFKDLASRDSSKDSVKLGAKSDFTNFDVAFLCDKILSLDSNILELGSGTGLVTNKIYDKVKSIVALEKFSEFSRHIIKDSKVKIINEDIFDFNIESRFDAILAFGFMHYFNESEAKIIYKKCFKWLKSSGKLVVKNQFGLKQDVTIEEFSKEQNREYYSQYRLLDKEMQILKYIGFKDIKSVDIYPKECNRWDNTHFYALIAQKP